MVCRYSFACCHTRRRRLAPDRRTVFRRADDTRAQRHIAAGTPRGSRGGDRTLMAARHPTCAKHERSLPSRCHGKRSSGRLGRSSSWAGLRPACAPAGSEADRSPATVVAVMVGAPASRGQRTRDALSSNPMRTLSRRPSGHQCDRVSERPLPVKFRQHLKQQAGRPLPRRRRCGSLVYRCSAAVYR